MTPEEIEQFLRNGRNSATTLAHAAESLKKWSDSFEQRGGALFTAMTLCKLFIFPTTCKHG